MRGLSDKSLKRLNSKKGIKLFLTEENMTLSKAVRVVNHEVRLKRLQEELIQLQHWVKRNNEKVVILFEGRDTAGKGGAIMRFVRYINPRGYRIVALNKPSDAEKGQWYFQRYISQFPSAGEIVLFDRSWYNRAVVEPVMGFCTDEQYEKFMMQVPDFEHLLHEDNLIIIKFWFSISKEEQKKRFDARLNNPLKRWKFSPVDMKGQQLWGKYSHYKELMFSKTHTNFAPWTIVKTNNKKEARLESMRHVLSRFNYDGKGESGITLLPDPNVIMRYHRSAVQIDI
mgnify:CR=1 FL=1